MKVVKISELLQKAERHGYGVGSFSPRNTFLIESVLRAAENCQSPVIVQISANEFKWFDVNAAVFAKRFYELRDSFSVPAALHLDHTKDFEMIREAVEAGFTSVMIDASQKEFDENVEITCKVVEFAHAHGVDVEAELGRIGATDKIETDNDEAFYTVPEQAAQFAERTGVDALAVSVGTAHGVYPVKNPRIDFERITHIRALTKVPLVLHGGSGLPEETVRKAIALSGGGVSKVNIATDLELVFLKELGLDHRLSNREVWQQSAEKLRLAGDEVTRLVENKIIHFVGSGGRMAEFL